MQTDFLIRPMAEQDVENVTSLLCELHMLHYTERPDIYIDSEKPFSEKTLRDLMSNSVPILVAQRENEIIGVCMASYKISQNPLCTKRKIGYIEAIYVKDNMRRRGIGKALYKAISDTVKESGAETIELNVYDFNTEAKAFYESVGMELKSRIMEIRI